MTLQKISSNEAALKEKENNVTDQNRISFNPTNTTLMDQFTASHKTPAENDYFTNHSYDKEHSQTLTSYTERLNAVGVSAEKNPLQLQQINNNDGEHKQLQLTNELPITNLVFNNANNKNERNSVDTYGLFRQIPSDAVNENSSGLQNLKTDSFDSIVVTSLASSAADFGKIGFANGGEGGFNGDLNGYFKNSKDSQLDSATAVKQEKWYSILLQVSIPFFLAGIGTIAAGIILGKVKEWHVYNCVAELFILVPALLGLKGNLDMCLASRLSTQANLGNMKGKKEVMRMIVGNIALVQVQATVASFLVAMFAASVGAAIDGSFQFEDVMLLVASAMFTATSSCFVLDFVLVAVILLSQKFQLNPDNLATPLAASIGDVVSISLLSCIASVLYNNIKTHLWITYVIVAFYVVLLPIWVTVVLKNKYTRSVLKSGWIPVLSALCISGLGGLVLNTAGAMDGFVVFQPIINGIGGNLVSVQASKISTRLHQISIFGMLPPKTKIFEWPWRALFKGAPFAETARLLIALSIPGNILFIFVADYIHSSKTTLNGAFLFSYLIASLLQLMLLLYIAHIMVHVMWKWKIDPDNASIPYLTSIGDLLGSSLLALAFFFLLSIGQQYGSGFITSTVGKQCYSFQIQ